MAEQEPDLVEIEPHEGCLEARLLGVFAVDRFNRRVEAAVQACRERKLTRLLLDITRVQATLTTLDRFEIASHGARVAAALRVAVIAAPEIIDPKGFGATVARNRGLTIDIFTDREKALAWLLAPRDA